MELRLYCGAGLSTALTDTIDIYAEGRYIDFGSAVGQTTNDRYSNDMSFAGLLIGLTAHFDDVINYNPTGEGMANAKPWKIDQATGLLHRFAVRKDSIYNLSCL